MSAVGDARKRLTDTADNQTAASHALLTHILDLLHDVPDCMTQHQAELFAEWLGQVAGSPTDAPVTDRQGPALLAIREICTSAIESHDRHLRVTQQSAPDHRPCESGSRAKLAERLLAVLGAA